MGKVSLCPTANRKWCCIKLNRDNNEGQFKGEKSLKYSTQKGEKLE